MKQNDTEVPFFEYWKRLFKRRSTLKVNDVGIYHNVFSFDTLRDTNHGLKYDIYAKVKIVEIYERLVEVQVLDIKINDSVSQDITNLIKHNFPKYVEPKQVKWQIKSQD